MPVSASGCGGVESGAGGRGRNLGAGTSGWTAEAVAAALSAGGSGGVEAGGGRRGRKPGVGKRA